MDVDETREEIQHLRDLQKECRKKIRALKAQIKKYGVSTIPVYISIEIGVLNNEISVYDEVILLKKSVILSHLRTLLKDCEQENSVLLQAIEMFNSHEKAIIMMIEDVRLIYSLADSFMVNIHDFSKMEKLYTEALSVVEVELLVSTLGEDWNKIKKLRQEISVIENL
jgi:hypothetical protein